MASRFWVGGTATWDATAGTKWSTTSGGAGGSAIPGTADIAIFDGGSGAAVVTVASSIGGTNTISGITFTGTGNFTGTLDFATNNPSITMSTFSGSGTGTRTINLGSGTFTITGVNGTVWDMATITGLTFSANSSTLLISAALNASRSVVFGQGLTYNIVTIANTASNGFTSTLSGNFTTAPIIGTLNLTAPIAISFQNALTVTNPVAWAGTSASNLLGLVQVSSNPTVNLAGASTIAWAAISNTTFTGSPTATNSFDLKGNSGITISGPSGGGGFVIGS